MAQDEFQDIHFDGQPSIPVKNFPSQKKKKKSKPKKKEIVNISVLDPKKLGEGINTYITYKVVTEFNNSEVKKIDRRYSDFKWLHTTLGSKIRGVIIPPIPSKDFLGRFISSDFIEKRRRGLEFFLIEVSRHDHLKEAKEFEIFLTADTSKLRLAMSNEQEDRNNWFQTFVDFKDYYLAPPALRDKTEEDEKCDAITEYTDELLKIITALDSQVQALNKQGKATSQSWFELGLSMSQLGAFQRHHGHDKVGYALTYLGKKSDGIANILSERIDVEEARDWSEPVNRYKKVVKAVQKMLKGRKDLLLTLQKEQANKLSLEKKLRNCPHEERNVLETEKAKSEQKASCLEQNLEEVTQRLFKEFENFKTTKASELKTLIINFGRIQTNYHAKMSETWNRVLECIQTNNYPEEDPKENGGFVDLRDL